MNMAVYVLNSFGSSPIPGKTASEIFRQEAGMNSTSETLDRLGIFGSKVIAYVFEQRRKKWDAKGKEALFMGYQKDMKGFRVYPENNRIEVVREIKFLREKEEIIVMKEEEPEERSLEIPLGNGNQEDGRRDGGDKKIQ